MISPTFAQWKKIFQFDRNPVCIFFCDTAINSQMGFVGLSDWAKMDTIISVFKTIDNGLHWKQCNIIGSPIGLVSDFTFKDSLVGWMSIITFNSSFCFKTMDGGENWYPLTQPINAHQGGWGIHYEPTLKKLYLSAMWTGILSSNDDGLIWNSYYKYEPIGFSFFSPTQGLNNRAFTNDGGSTWTDGSGIGDECYQPLAVPSTSYAFAINDYAKIFNYSSDFGITWRQSVQFNERVSGCVRGDLNHIVIQLQQSGAYYSSDTGQSFINLCGPPNVTDTRFWMKGDTIFMGDPTGGLYMNSSGIGSNSTPQISSNAFAVFTTHCKSIDSQITLTFFDSCNGIQAQLVEISLSGSNKFSLVSGTNIRELRENDSITFRYDPRGVSSNDTAFIKLKFHLGFKDFDTTITLIGSSPSFNYTPQISAIALSLRSLNCKPVDSIVILTLFDSCNGIQGDLSDISLSGSGRFSLTSGGNVRQLQENDSIGIRYDPQGNGADTALLKLTFHLGFKDFDTTIMLTGMGSNGPEHVGFSMGVPITSEVAQQITVSLTPNRTFTGKGLTSLSFDLNYNGDLLGMPKCLSSIVSFGPEIVVGRKTTLPVTITQGDIALDSLNPIATISFKTYLTDTSETAITMTNLKLNGGDPDYANCVLSADTTSTSYSQILRCGEPTLQHFLKTNNILSIASINPNPTNGGITMVIMSPTKEESVIMVNNILGKLVMSETKQLVKGENRILLDTKGLIEGRYSVSVASGQFKVQSQFIKQ